MSKSPYFQRVEVDEDDSIDETPFHDESSCGTGIIPTTTPTPTATSSSSSSSEWKMLLRCEISKIKSNIDFRNTTMGVSVIDPIVFQELRQAKQKIWNTLSWKLFFLWIFESVTVLVPFTFLMILMYDGNSMNKAVENFIYFLGTILAFGLVILLHAYQSPRFFREADSKMEDLVNLYKLKFQNDYGIELRHSPPTNVKTRWRSDDSGISMIIRPRRQEEQQQQQYENEDRPSTNARGRETTSDGDGGGNNNSFPPIFVTLTIPGDIHIHEKMYDPSMKVDKATWSLLQRTHMEMMSSHQPTMMAIAILILIFLFAIPLSTSSIVFAFGFVGVFIFWIIIGLFIYLLYRYTDRRNVQLCHDVCQRVNDVLQKNHDTTMMMILTMDQSNSNIDNIDAGGHDNEIDAGGHDNEIAATAKNRLTVEFLTSDLPGRYGKSESLTFQLWASRRYQFILRRPIPSRCTDRTTATGGNDEKEEEEEEEESSDLV